MVGRVSAKCAGCLQPIEKGQPFVLSGTEVFHRTVRCQRLIAKSVLTRLRTELVQAKAEALENRRQAANARIDKQNLEAEVTQAHQARDRARAVGDSWIAQYRSARDHGNQLQSDNAALTSERAQLRNELAAARAEIAQLKDAALRRATQDIVVQQETNDTRDDTEIRFSLLEIDDP